MEMWIKPKAEFKPELRCYLLDKYVDHTDYQWQIGDADQEGCGAALGDAGLEQVEDDLATVPAGRGGSVAFTYDGLGEESSIRNGIAAGGAKLEGGWLIVPGKRLVGDRLKRLITAAFRFAIRRGCASARAC